MKTLAAVEWTVDRGVAGHPVLIPCGFIYVQEGGSVQVCVSDDYYNGTLSGEGARELLVALQKALEPK